MSNPLGVQADSMTLDVRAPAAGARSRLFNSPATTTGIIVIAVVGCVVGTSLIWVVIIYQMRRKNDEYSPTPTDKQELLGKARLIDLESEIGEIEEDDCF